MTAKRSWIRAAQIVLSLSLAFACGGRGDNAPARVNTQTTPAAEARTLREQAERTGFLVGTTIAGGDAGFAATDLQRNSLMAEEFNYVTDFANMSGVETERGKFNFAKRDAEVAFARAKGIKVKAHPLIWGKFFSGYDDVPAWLKFNQPDCGGWSAAELDQIMKEWIQGYVSHFKGLIAVYDVVNEPFKRSLPPGATRQVTDADLKPGPYTPSDLQDRCWKTILGEDYIAKAFRYAHEADPDAILSMNDQFGSYGTDRVQQDKFLELVRKLKAQGVPINAVGTQMHLGGQVGPENVRSLIPQPGYLDDLRDFLTRAKEIGVDVHITEMDVYLPPDSNQQQKLKDIFKSVLTTCLEFSNCQAFTVWGIADKDSKVRAVHTDSSPLLFDDAYKPKAAYYGVLEALKRQ